MTTQVKNVTYSNFANEYLDDMINVAVGRFGENYIDRKKILDHVNCDNEMCTLALDENGNVLGYCLFFEDNMNSAEKDFKIPKQELISVTGSDSSICHTKSMALRKDCEKMGLGYNLFNRTLNKAQKIGYKAAWCPAWKRGSYVPVKNVLLKSGFTFFKTVHRIWEDDKNYTCVECNGPCKCDAAIYYKILN